MSFYTSLAATATKLIKDKGQLVYMTKTTNAAYTPAAGAPAGVEARVALYGVAKGFPLGKVDGSLIRSGDISVLLEGGKGDPADYDAIEVAGKAYTIVNRREIAPGGTPVVYEAHLRIGV